MDLLERCGIGDEPTVVDDRGIEIRLQSAGSVSGRIWDVRGEGLAGVEIELLAERSE